MGNLRVRNNMEKISGLIIGLSKPLSITVLLCLYLVFVMVVFPSLSGEMKNAPPIDLAFTYTADEVYNWIDAYGTEGRASYMRGEMTIDIIYPLVYTALFIGILGFATQYREYPRLSGYRWVVISPLFIWFFDLLENSGIVLMLMKFPEQLNTVALLTSYATTLKWSSAILVILTTIVACTYRLVQHYQK